jgi:hypothetical protein
MTDLDFPVSCAALDKVTVVIVVLGYQIVMARGYVI